MRLLCISTRLFYMLGTGSHTFHPIDVVVDLIA